VGNIRTSEARLAGGIGEAGQRRRRVRPEAEERLAGGRRMAGRRRKGPLKFGRDEGLPGVPRPAGWVQGPGDKITDE